MFLFRKGKKEHKKTTRIFFATDIHGSTPTFKKFLNAAILYKADVAILGGDITGKLMVPLLEQSEGSYKTELMGVEHLVKTTEEIRELEKTITLNGFYPYRVSERQMEELNSNPVNVEELFAELVIERLKNWCTIAEERLMSTGLKIYITGGNDDIFEIEPVLKSSNFIIDPEGEVICIDDDHEMISSGYGNITPWKCPRDVSEEKLEKILEAVISKVENMRSCIFNLHVPPIDSTLDTCAKLDTKIYPPRPIPGDWIAAGSTAVRAAIERHQPLLGLHGHIHESRGAVRIGRTLCVNPGSEYSEGILRGIIINLEKDKIKPYQFTSG